MGRSKSCTSPCGPSNNDLGPVTPRAASMVAYTARTPVLAGEMLFQFETGSACTVASDTLSVAAAAMAFAVCSTPSPSSFAVPAATDIDSCSA